MIINNKKRYQNFNNFFTTKNLIWGHKGRLTPRPIERKNNISQITFI